MPNITLSTSPISNSTSSANTFIANNSNKSSKQKKKKEKKSDLKNNSNNSTPSKNNSSTSSHASTPFSNNSADIVSSLDIASRDDLLEKLLSMGFLEKDCLQAISLYGKNMDLAISWLCEKPAESTINPTVKINKTELDINTSNSINSIRDIQIKAQQEVCYIYIFLILLYLII